MDAEDAKNDELAQIFHDLTQSIGCALQGAGFFMQGGSDACAEISRLSEDFEQGILLQRDLREHCGRCFEIHVFIRSLYSTGARAELLHQPVCDLDRRFQVCYPLTRDCRRLAENLTSLLMESIVPFLDQFATCTQVLAHYRQLPTDIPLIGERLVYISAFRERHWPLFMEYNTRLIEQARAWVEQLKKENADLPEDAFIDLAQPIADGMRERGIFADDALFAAEIARQDRRKEDFLKSHRPSSCNYQSM